MGERHVVPLEERHTNSSLLAKWRYWAPSDISTARAKIPHQWFHSPFSTKSWMAACSMRSRVLSHDVVA
jgi:hypothetical protein